MKLTAWLHAGLFICVVCCGQTAEAQRPAQPGRAGEGFLLPNGWRVTPAGRQVPLSDLPLNVLALADGRRALVATSGYNRHELTLVELETGRKLDTAPVLQSWFGLVINRAGDRVWWSGGAGERTHHFTLESNRLKRTSEPEGPLSFDRVKRAQSRTFRSGMEIDEAQGVLYRLDIDMGTITTVDLKTGAERNVLTLGGRPYDVRLSPNRAQLYVSDWARGVVMVVSPDGRKLGQIAVGEHPNQIAVHPKDDRIFVACASSNSVAAIDTKRGVVTETIVTSLFPRAPEGSTPDALAVAPDGNTLFVANADNNCVAVIDISKPNESEVRGFIPTGWYPTAVAVTPDGKQLLVGVGKGSQTRANPPAAPANKNDPAAVPAPDKANSEKNDADKKNTAAADKPGDPASDKPAAPEKPRAALGSRATLPYPYIGETLSGSLAIVPVPDEKQLVAYTETVYRNCPYSDKLLTAAPHPHKTAIPTRVGDKGPIEYVIYIIKENRTYDQVFGDIERGNGDPSLVLFGRDVTPNHHKLADEFVLLDNLYCNGHVSADGHPWSTMAYNTDYIAKNWAITYSRRSGVDDDEEGNLSKAPSGYLWDACARQGISYRSYGEYGRRVSQPDGTVRVEGRVPGLVGHMCPDYGIAKRPGQEVRDTDNVDVFLREFREFERNGNLPRFIVMSLGENHTFGTTPGAFTPQACVASNDLALGRLVEAMTASKYWPKMAIFVIEDDAQNGPDHVDAHRTVGLVISPYVRRKSIDSTQYSTVSMIRTMELILGIPPLSQFDAAAQPMFASFSDRADLTGYQHEKARVNLQAKNGTLAYGAERSRRMDFGEYDRIDDFELNEILWRAIKGKDAPLPPAVRRAIAYRIAPRE